MGNTPRLDEYENEIIDQLRRMYKWETDDYICMGHILNATSKRFLVSNFNTFKMVYERPVMDEIIIGKLLLSWKEFK